MKKLFVLAAALFVCGLAGSANAADMPTKAPVYKAPPVVAPYNWTGFYLGVNGGYGWGTTSGSILPTFFAGNYDINGGLFGGQIGYNYQFPASHFVLGIEADWDWADIKGSQSIGPPAPPGTTDSLKVKDLGTVRGRIGYAWDRFLVYGTGGWAWSSSVSAFCSGCAVQNESHSLNGYVLGAGVEYGFTPNLSAKVEYLYTHLEPVDFFRNSGCPTNCSLGANVNMIRAGLNWRFTGFPY